MSTSRRRASKVSAASPPPASSGVGLSGADLLRLIASGGVVPRSEEWRPFFGKALTPTRIESALLSADNGFLQDLTDIGAEQLCYDPHLASLLGKRIGRLGVAPWDVTPAQGAGVDKKYALAAAELVRTQFQAVPSFSQAVEDLAWAHWDGRGALEIHWERMAFGWRLAEYGWVAPRRLSLGRRREIRLVEGIGTFGFAADGIAIEDLWAKFVTCKPRLFNEYPEREGLLRRAIFWSFHKRFAARERAIILELLRHGRQLLKEKDGNTRQYTDAELAQHADRLDGMNTGSTTFVPSGLEFDTKDIDSEATDGHEKMIDSVDRQLSKLVLGGIGTTDEVKGGGIGAKTSETHEGQQQFIFDRDGIRIAERFQLCAVRPMLVLNKNRLGIASDDDVLALAPLFTLRTQKPTDRIDELKRVKAFLDLGAAIALDEARQISGFRKPDADEAILQLVDSPQVEGSSRYIEPRVRVIDPTGTEPGQDTGNAPPPVTPAAPAAAEQDPAPAAPPAGEPAAAPLDLEDDDDWGIYSASVLGVQADLDELRDALSLADGEVTNFPKRGDNLRVSLRNSGFKIFPPAEAAALREEWPEIWRAGGNVLGNLQFRRLLPVAKRGGVVETDTEEEAVRLREAWAAQHYADHELPGVVAQVKWLVVGEQGIERMRRVIADAKARKRASEAAHEPLLLARQPSTPNGSPESVIATYKRAALPVLSGWASAFERGVRGDTASAIRASLRKVARGLNEAPLAAHLERTLLHAALLGAMDAEYEAENDVALAPVTFDAHGEPVLLVAGFATKPFTEAIDFFLTKEVVSREVFDKLEAAAKSKAFTIAGLAKKEMLQTGFDALATSIREGRDLRTFRKDLNARFDSAGWSRLNPSHVETIFRNGVMGAYSSGRERQMSQPHVLKARPYWQILGVDDARTRKPHRRAHGKVLNAGDPFFQRAGPPFGHNCRCRVVSRSEKDLKRLALKVTAGRSLSGLPDPGWTPSPMMAPFAGPAPVAEKPAVVKPAPAPPPKPARKPIPFDEVPIRPAPMPSLPPEGVRKFLEDQRGELAKLDVDQEEAVKRFTHGYDWAIREVDKGLKDDAILEGIRKHREYVLSKNPKKTWTDTPAEHLAMARRYHADLYAGLDKMSPASERIVYRGLSVDEATFHKIRSAAHVDIGSISSTSWSVTIARSFADGDQTHGILLQLKTRSGYGIEDISAYGAEHELVLKRGVRFKATRVYRPDDRPDSECVIEAEEI